MRVGTSVILNPAWATNARPIKVSSKNLDGNWRESNFTQGGDNAQKPEVGSVKEIP